MPTKNDVFFTAASWEKGHHFWWASQSNFGPSYFVRAIGLVIFIPHWSRLNFSVKSSNIQRRTYKFKTIFNFYQKLFWLWSQWKTFEIRGWRQKVPNYSPEQKISMICLLLIWHLLLAIGPKLKHLLRLRHF